MYFFVKKEKSPVKETEVQPKKSFLSQKKKEPEPPKQEEKPGEGDMFKLKKKSSVTPRKQIEKKEEEPAFGGFKLKKAETVKRSWDDGGLENVNLKHHEFEKEPENEQVTYGPQSCWCGHIYYFLSHFFFSFLEACSPKN